MKTKNNLRRAETLNQSGPKKRWLLGIVIFCLVALMTGGGFLWYDMAKRSHETNEVASSIEFSREDKNNYQFAEQKNPETISEVAAKVSPSVVSIITASQVETIFGQRGTQQGAGSGVILSKDGYILTNKHVINRQDSIMVILSNGQTYEDVKVIFSDPINDLAVLKVGQVDNLAPIEIGDSKTIKVGQPVLAIGNALGEYQNTVTNGIISGIGRNITARSGSSLSSQTENLTDLIQTNAAINSGNSGGPLVNAGGQLIGINTAVAENANGIGFAIPIGATKGIIKQLRSGKSINRVFLGVQYIELNPTLARQNKLDVVRGALIDSNGIVAGSAADRAGLKGGDIVTKVGQYEVGLIGGLSTLLAEYAPDEEVVLTVLRQDKTMSVNVKLDAYPDSQNLPK